MLENNKKIVLSGEAVLEALAEIEFILISLHKMGSYYSDKKTEEYQRATTEFIDNEKVTQKLAKVRRILSENFDTSLGEDDMDDIERYMENIEFWKPQN
ncbi:hypothetical protein CXQ81_03390 [Pseudomonas sp. 09C 129]|uniref:hypothetical protein n=1 Tax=Pseudomonas sp. 09C 129 TaxID=2054915 RepID=UPI000C6D02D4|nr:hypothetical protein [Pseudomonas sp. 09C 129]AUF99672.1 hypothetical protein CXQ81_03390 [Pseudomonas sp. 09C 129]